MGIETSRPKKCRAQKGEVNVFIPGGHIGKVAMQLVRRTNKYGGASMVGSPGQDWPGLHVCKKCPMVRYKEMEE